MLKDLVLNLREKNYAAVMGLLAREHIYACSDEDLEWLGYVNNNLIPFSAIDRKYILDKAVKQNVYTPELMHALLLAGYSPLAMARCFASDPYRLALLYKLLPLIPKSRLDILEKQEAIADQVFAYNSEQVYRTCDYIEYSLPSLPVIFQGYTSEFKYAANCYVNGKPFGSANFYEIDFDEVMFGLEIHEYLCNMLKKYGMDCGNTEAVSYNYQQYQDINSFYDARIIATFLCIWMFYFLFYYIFASILASRQARGNVDWLGFDLLAMFVLSLFTSVILAKISSSLVAYNYNDAELKGVHDVFQILRYKLAIFWLNHCEKFDFIAKSASLIQDLRERHQPYVEQHGCPQALLFWQKVFVDKSKDQAQQPASDDEICEERAATTAQRQIPRAKLA